MSALQQRLRVGIGRAQSGDRRRSWQAFGAKAGSVGLLLCLVATLTTFSGWLGLVLVGLTTLLLAFDRRLGPIPAAMLVMLAIPVGRGAEVGLATITDIPIRPHDVAALVGVGLVLPGAVAAAVRRPASLITPATVPFTVFLLVGLGALVVGVLDGNELRDIVRDTRWWSLYAVGLLALLTRTPPAALTRALIWGMTLYAVVIMIGMLLPGFPGGLKLGAYFYDERMRLHYGQAIFLLPLAAYAVTRAFRRPIPWVAVLGLAAAAVSITLTRALIVTFIGVVLLALVWSVVRARRGDHDNGIGSAIRRLGPRIAMLTLAVVIGLAGGVGVYSAGIRIWNGMESGAGIGPSSDRPAVDASSRLTGREGTDLASQGVGRLPSYARAFVQTSHSPLLGNGMGQLTFVNWVRGEFAGHTRNAQPGVDNAYLTAGIKAGAAGIAAITLLLLWPLRRFLAVPRRRMWAWYMPAWLGILGLSLIESFAVSGYAPFTLSALIALPLLRFRPTS